MKNALAGIASILVAGTIAVSCSASSDPGQPGTGPKDASASGSCGASGEGCCNGTACDNGLSCKAGTCAASASDAAADGPDTPVVGTRGGDASSDGASPESPTDAAGTSTDAPADAVTDACGGGEYAGTLTGLCTSLLTPVGIPVPVTGQVNLTLATDGRVLRGTITGIEDTLFPFSCWVNGALDCARGAFDGWLECTYCAGPVADGGLSCAMNSGGTSGVGGHYAGTFNAAYDFGTHAFITGRWNGSEALAGNDGGSPGPDGGPASSYLADSGLYVGAGEFGGSGTWSATRQ